VFTHVAAGRRRGDNFKMKQGKSSSFYRLFGNKLKAPKKSLQEPGIKTCERTIVINSSGLQGLNNQNTYPASHPRLRQGSLISRSHCRAETPVKERFVSAPSYRAAYDDASCVKFSPLSKCLLLTTRRSFRVGLTLSPLSKMATETVLVWYLMLQRSSELDQRILGRALKY
jgi:hypothetical protein